MKPLENTEDVVRRSKTKVTTDPCMDKRVLEDSFVAMDEALSARRSSVARFILRSRGVRYAAAVVILLALGLLALQPGPSESEQPPVARTTRSPAERLSAMSLNMAYRRGGIEALDELSHEVFEALGPPPTRVSARELRSETNGV